jgi:excisionase family DNA binding protein
VLEGLFVSTVPSTKRPPFPERTGFAASPLTVAEVAERLQRSEVSVRRKIRDGTIPAIRLSRAGRGALRVPEHELEDWLDDRHVRRDGGAGCVKAWPATLPWLEPEPGVFGRDACRETQAQPGALG